MDILVPALWLIVLIGSLPQVSEIFYTPSLPDIAESLGVSESMVEYTLTIDFFGLAIGTFFWGMLSDKIGRKSCVLGGVIVFIMGCFGCYYAHTITALMISRFVQSFGASIGSVIGQAICRDVFHGKALSKAYSSMNSALAVIPAAGPLMGGVIAQWYGWSNMFLLLIGFGLVLTLLVMIYLPETHHADNRKYVSLMAVTQNLFRDKRVIGFGLIIAVCNAITFIYFAEGAFYFIKILGLSPSQYGLSFIPIAVFTMLGGIVSKYLHNWRTSEAIMGYGIQLIMAAASLFSIITFCFVKYAMFSPCTMIFAAISMQMMIMFGICMVNATALALALVDYQWCVGTALSLFGCFYFLCVSLFTFGMAWLHNGTLLVMPFYFFALSGFMLLVQRYMLRD